MDKNARRLVAVFGILIGLALIAPVAWFYGYRTAHHDASVSIEAAVFFALVAFFGLQIALRSAWRAIRGA